MATSKTRSKKATTKSAAKRTAPARKPAANVTPEEPEAPVATAEPAPEPQADQPVATLADLATAYLRALEDEGKSISTVRSYRADLALACSVIGAEQKLADLTPEQVAAFNDHPRVTHTADGVPKAKSGMLKHRRVLRLALVWAAQEGLVEAAPLPDGAAE